MIEKMRVDNGLPDEDDLVYSSIDVLRYVMSMLNLWEIAPEDVSLAFSLKDVYLDLDHKVNSKSWEGQPVAIVDIDDVLAEFRTPFADFLRRVYDIEADVDSDQYFFVEDILKASGNINSLNQFFDRFLKDVIVSWFIGSTIFGNGKRGIIICSGGQIKCNLLIHQS